MIKNIVKDTLFLSQKAIPATKEDKYIAQELIDTLLANQYGCVGMAANMIGYNKSVIVFSTGFMPIIMFNPIITKKNKKYNTKESCLSLIGERDCVRYEEIEVDYYDINFEKKNGKYSGFIAEIIQHEIDHLNGIII